MRIFDALDDLVVWTAKTVFGLGLMIVTGLIRLATFAILAGLVAGAVAIVYFVGKHFLAGA